MSKTHSLKEIMTGWEAYPRPVEGSLFKRYKSAEYSVVATGFFEEFASLCVIYRSLKKEIIWVLSAKNFFEMVEHEGRAAPRFELQKAVS